MIVSTNISELRYKYRSDNFVAFSTDIDWASEYCIQDMLDFFTANDIPLTVFCTHPSKVLSEARANPLIELGIHPNYTVGSSQGSTIDEVTDYCMKLVPDARGMRGHRWYGSNDVYDTLLDRGILYSSNECTMMDLVDPYIHRHGILCMPAFLEDGGLLWNEIKPDFTENGKKYFSQDGLKVVDLHPIHFTLNVPTYKFYRDVCSTFSRGEYNLMEAETAAELSYKGLGMRNYVMELVEFVKANRVNIVSLGQVYDELEYYS